MKRFSMWRNGRRKRNNRRNAYIAGHSLGGGLASAASIMSGFHAYTFNAAGLHQGTVYNNINLANAAQLIDSYRVDYDILSWGQWIPGWLNYVFVTPIPAAIGTTHTIDSEYDAEMVVSITVTVGSAVVQLYPLTALGGLSVVAEGILCHLMDQVIYGMENEIF